MSASTARVIRHIGYDMAPFNIEHSWDGQGARLPQLRDQDSCGDEIATIFVGADSDAELRARYQACLERLPLRLVPVDAGQAADGGARGHRA